MQDSIYVGMVCEANFSVSPDNFIFQDVWLPIHIVAEHKYWWDAIVTQHKNPHSIWDDSKPYHMSINKHALTVGEIQIRKKIK